MINKIWKILLILLVFSTALFAQEKGNYLLSIHLRPGLDFDRFENLQIPIYHRLPEILIAEVAPEQLPLLNHLPVDYQILDVITEPDDYFIVQSPSGKEISINPEWGDILFIHPTAVILKVPLINPANFVESDYRITSLKRTPWFFKNERVIPLVRKNISIDAGTIELLNEINADSVRYFIQSLQDFGTRFLFAATRDSVANWVKNQFLRMGITDVRIDSFLYSSTWQKNVVATIPGSINPDQVYVIGGHHDSYSYSNPAVYAPGADDNASGSAAALEIARAMKAIGYQPEATIKFVTFAAEEYGLWGSKDFAQKAAAAGMNIALMINHDMISYTTDPPGNWEVGMNYYSGSEYLLELTSQLIARYTTLIPRVGTLNASFSDSYSFWTKGFPAFYFEEWDFSPYYHSPNDVISNYNMDFCAEVIRASGALLLCSSATPAIVQGFQLFDRGNGTSLELVWLPNNEPDIGHYNVYVGISSGVYDTSYSTLHSPYVVNGLSEGVRYYIGLSAVDTAGNESFIVEKSAIPYSIPFPPQHVQDFPDWQKIKLSWRSNPERDILGYNLYRADASAGQQVKINPQVISDTFYVDQTAQNGLYYYYAVRAVDSLLNESENSEEVRSRVISLDQGILVVDETADGNGTLLNPTDQQVDSFYTAILTGFPITMYDMQSEGGIKLADLGAFSTVIWHGNDFSEFTLTPQIRGAIQNYLQVGGKMLISEVHPSRAFADNVNYPRNFSTGDFIYDYLKVERVEFSVPARFLGAVPLPSEYDSIYVDSTKSILSLNYHLLKVESISAIPPAQNIYQYDSWYASNTSQGSLKGKPVGIEYLGNDYRLVLISFPLYYMNFSEAQQFIHRVLIDKFCELTSVSEKFADDPIRFQLLPNFPNPFNPETIIGWQIAKRSRVQVKIFSVLGQTVRTLFDDRQEAGYHSLIWDGRDDQGRWMASGIYLCRLWVHPEDSHSTDFIQTRKVILLK